MSELDEYPECYNYEYKQWVDDCGARYCTLTKLIWYTWSGEDFCSTCPYVVYE